MVTKARELLSSEKSLSGLFGGMCNGPASELYDFYALRTEPGSARQAVHSDTPHQDIPGLFYAFVALMGVTMEMGGTMFIPKINTRTKGRRRFDGGDKDEMLRKAKP